MMTLVEYRAWIKSNKTEAMVMAKIGMDAKIRDSSDDFAKARFVILDTVFAEIKIPANTNVRKITWNQIGHLA